jgi:hypothetical protein
MTVTGLLILIIGLSMSAGIGIGGGIGAASARADARETCLDKARFAGFAPEYAAELCGEPRRGRAGRSTVRRRHRSHRGRV